MRTLSASEARRQLYRLIDLVASEHEPVLIAGKRNNAVLVGEEDWRSIRETLYLTAMPGMAESIKVGLATPAEEMAGELQW